MYGRGQLVLAAPSLFINQNHSIMYYQIHIEKKGDDGIFRHIPLYFLTTTDFNTAKENFQKVVDNFFHFEEKPKVEEFKDANIFCERMRATGEITAHYNVCGTYCIALCETFRDVALQPIV